MRIIILLPLLMILILLPDCALFRSSSVPNWYKKDYTDSGFIYGKGRGTSQREELAIKKAETAAQSELGSQANLELKKIISHLMQSEGIDKNNSMSKRYQSVRKKVLLEIHQIAKIEEKEIRHDQSLFSAFILLKLDKAELKEFYLYTLKENKK